MDKEEIERLTKVEERSKSNSHRLDKLEPIVDEIHTMSKTMVQLVGEVKHTNDNVIKLDEKLDKMDARVDQMESLPGKKWNSMQEKISGTIISALFGAAVTGVIWAIAQTF